MREQLISIASEEDNLKHATKAFYSMSISGVLALLTGFICQEGSELVRLFDHKIRTAYCREGNCRQHGSVHSVKESVIEQSKAQEPQVLQNRRPFWGRWPACSTVQVLLGTTFDMISKDWGEILDWHLARLLRSDCRRTGGT